MTGPLSFNHMLKLGERIKIAGYELMQGHVAAAYKSLIPIQSDTYTRQVWHTEPNGGNFFFWKDNTSSLNAYNTCPPITAIVNRQAQAYVNGKTWILNSKGKESTTPDAVKLRNRILHPNPLQNWKQFEAQGKIYQKLYGYNVVLIIKPFGFTDPIDASALWNITPWCSIILKNTTNLYGVNELKDVIARVDFVYEGFTTPLNLDDLFIMRDLSAPFTNLLFPTSPIQTLAGPVGVVIGAIESEKIIIDQRGPAYMISSGKTDDTGNVPMQPHEKKKVQEEFEQYGFRAGQSKVIITNAAINVSPMGYNMKELLLHESVREATMLMCQVLNFPPFVLGLADTTFSNMDAAEKALYQNSVIPDAENNYEQWNDLFKTGDRNLKIDKDFSHISVLQENKVEQGQARFELNRGLLMEFQNNLLTLNEWRDALEQDPIPDGDKYYRELVAMGWVFGSQPALPKPTGDASNQQEQNNNQNTQNPTP